MTDKEKKKTRTLFRDKWCAESGRKVEKVEILRFVFVELFILMSLSR